MKGGIKLGGAKFYLDDANAPKPNKPNHIGAVAIIESDDRVLLEQRADSGKWSFIGGGLELTESLEDCVRREVLEETSLKVMQLDFLGIFSNPNRIAEYPDGNVLRIITVAYITTVELKAMPKCSKESIQLRYFTLEELDELDLAETHKDIRARDICKKIREDKEEN